MLTTKPSDFMQFLYQNCEVSKFIELRIFSNSKPTRKFIRVGELTNVDQIVADVGKSNNVYFGIATRNNHQGGKKSDCYELPAIFIDIDYGAVGHKKDSNFRTNTDVLEHLKKADLGYSTIINSGHGFHIYWVLETPIRLTSENIVRVENIMKKISLVLGGDSTYDVSRILRVPGSYNIKSKEPVEASIVECTNSNKYSLVEIEYIVANKPIFHVPLSKIVSDPGRKTIDQKSIPNKEFYLSAIWGINDFGNDDRSEIDAKIIYYLIDRGFTDKEIELLFYYFPTSGKYHERYKLNLNSANQYLKHSINKMRKYNMESKTLTIYRLNDFVSGGNNSPKQNEIVKMKEVINDNEEINYSPTEMQFQKDYIMFNNDLDTGYYKRSSNSDAISKLTNFVINFHSQVQNFIDGETVSFFTGELKINDGTQYSFQNLPAAALVNPKDLFIFITNLAGTKIQYESNYNEIVAAIKKCNETIPVVNAKEFGYSETLDCYYTEELFINSKTISKIVTPIKHYEMYGTNKLKFTAIKSDALNELKNKIIETILNYDEFKVIYPLMSFTFLPLIHPFIKNIIAEKPYLMLQGTSGSGKSFLTKVVQRFYGDYENLCGWSSTDTSLGIIGHSHKDAIFTVDDLKIANFPTDKDRRKAMQMIQNYADNVGRQRSNTALKIRDPKYIRGFLLISAEDIVFSESSTIARGIIINVKSKEMNFPLVNKITELSKKINGITPHFIQFVMTKYNNMLLENIFEEKRKIITEMLEAKGSEITLDNLARISNNFAQLATSFEVFNSFFFENNHIEMLNNEKRFMQALEELLTSNLKRIKHLKPEEKFIKTLWDLIDATIVTLHDVDKPLYDKSKVIGYFKYSKKYHELPFEQNLINANVKICINLDRAFKAVNSYLMSEGGIGTTKDALKNKLASDGNIIILESGRVSFTSTLKYRGVEWVGKYPRELFGLLENEDKNDNSLNQVIDIIDENNEIELKDDKSVESDIPLFDYDFNVDDDDFIIT